ncbi:MAG: hypothetical protein AB1521_08880 [Bacteroidota bacterium]
MENWNDGIGAWRNPLRRVEYEASDCMKGRVEYWKDGRMSV